MAKLNDQFAEFLSNIEPDEDAIKYAQKAHQPVRKHLEEDDDFGEFFEDSFLYGSYARHTAIGEIKDIDIVVLTNFDPNNEDYSPTKVLKKLKTALNKFYKDADNTEYQRKSVKVKDPLPNYPNVYMTLDIIPAIAIDGVDNPLLVPDIETNTWVQSHPKGHMDFTSELNDEQHCDGNFVPLVKMMKHWWNYNKVSSKAKPKGFWLEILVGNEVDSTFNDFADYIVSTLENISEKYSDYEQLTALPELEDPGLIDQQIKTSMTLEEFRNFVQEIKASLEIAKRALNEEDLAESSKLWRSILGEEFPVIESTSEPKKSFNVIAKDRGIWMSN